MAVFIKRNGRAPLKVAGDASADQTLVKKLLRERYSVGRPLALDLSLMDPFFQLWLNFREIDKDVLCLPQLWSRMARRALWLDKFRSVDKLAAAIALVTLCIIEVAHWAFSSDIPVSEESVALGAIELVDNFLERVASLVDIIEDVLSNLSVFGGGGAAECVEVAVEPLVDLLVDFEVLVANLARGLALLLGLSLSRCAILVSAADVNRVMPGESGVARKHITGENATDNVAEVRHIVNVRQGTSDQNVTLAWDWALLG